LIYKIAINICRIKSNNHLHGGATIANRNILQEVKVMIGEMKDKVMDMKIMKNKIQEIVEVHKAFIVFGVVIEVMNHRELIKIEMKDKRAKEAILKVTIVSEEGQ